MRSRTPRNLAFTIAATSLAAVVSAQHVEVFPDTPPPWGSNVIPFGRIFTSVNHQVYAASLFGNISGGQPVEITRVAYSPTSTSGTFSGNVTIRMGYTDRVGGQQPPVGLDIPDLAGGGAPNAVGSLETFFDGPAHHVIVTNDPEVFDFVFDGGSFVYDPAQGNLLVEIHITSITSGFGCSRANGSEQSSRSYIQDNGVSNTLPTQALRTEFTFTVGGTVCYPDCDENETLDFFDFLCFQNAFLAQDPYADCDQNGVFDFFDFLCFQNEFLAGC
jgi:hypothetical protein